jgi:radical SAM superfamily enzyme YgiQ (UPF0313 family)
MIVLLTPYSGEREYELCDPNIAILYLAAAMTHHDPVLNHLVLDTRAEQMDAAMTVDRLKQLQPDIVGISSTTNQFPDALKIAQGVRAALPHANIVFGGAHASALPAETVSNEEIDYVVVGEGEVTFCALAVYLLHGVGTLPNGVYYLKDGDVQHTGLPERIQDLDVLPFPDFSELPIDVYFKHQRRFAHAKRTPYLPVITSRGCPARCTFCSHAVFGYRPFLRSPENVVAEIKQNVKRFGIREVRIMDDCFNIDIDRVIRFCKLVVEEKLDLSFALPNGMRADRVSVEMLQWMKRAGFYMIFFGVESGEQSVLKKIKKGTQIDKVGEVISLCKSMGFYTCAFFVVGLPGSSAESERKTLAFANQYLPDFIGVAMCTPYPGSAIYEERQQALDWSSYKHDFSKQGSVPLYIPAGRTAEDMLFWYKKIYFRFYSNPFYLFGRLRHLPWLIRRVPFFLNAFYRRFIKRFS